MVSFITVLCAVLGFFEFVVVFGFYTQDVKKGVEKHRVLPETFITDYRTKLLYCTCILFLAMQRLTFASGGVGILPWLCLVVTHSIEAIFWWALALHPSFNKKSLNVVQMAVSATTFKLPGGVDTFLLLIVVPVIVITMILLGPNTA